MIAVEIIGGIVIVYLCSAFCIGATIVTKEREKLPAGASREELALQTRLHILHNTAVFVYLLPVIVFILWINRRHK